MNYQLKTDKIIIQNKDEFNSKHILECGQIFRYEKVDENTYAVYSGNKKAVIIENQTGFEIQTTDVKYFENFFDLKTDYSLVKQQLSLQNPTMKEACLFGGGIRILKQQPFEIIISFIISANNNIKRIQNLIKKLCEKCGTKTDDYFAFPTLEQIEALSIEDLKTMGMGFRAKHIYETVRKLKAVDLQNYYEKSTNELLNFLQTLSGVGPKVADCIALFAYNKQDCFPVDTWVEKVYNCYFSAEQISNRNLIRKNLVEIFGNSSGYAQQYLFYYKRELDKKGK